MLKSVLIFREKEGNGREGYQLSKTSFIRISLTVSQRAKERPETMMPELETRMWPERRFRAIINQK